MNLDLTLAQVAALTGLYRNTVSRAERGVGSPHPSTWAAIDQALCGVERERGIVVDVDGDGSWVTVEIDLLDGRHLRVRFPHGPDTPEMVSAIVAANK